MSSNTKGITLMLVSALMVGSYGVWSRLMGPYFDLFYQGWSRGLIITLLLLPILLYAKQIVPIQRKDWKWMAIFVVFTSLTQAPLYYAFNHMDIGSATLLFFVNMLLTMYVVGFVFLNEKLTRVKAISFVLAALGMYVIFSFSLVAFTLLAALMAILNGVASGGEVAFSKKLSSEYSPLYLSWISWVAIFITNAPISIMLNETQHLPSFEIEWLYQVGYVAAGIIGFWSVIKGLKYIEASIGGLIGLLEIVFSVSFGILLFQEELTAKVIIGGILILVAATLPHVIDLLKGKELRDAVAV